MERDSMNKNKTIKLISLLAVASFLFSTAVSAKNSDDFFDRGFEQEVKIVIEGDTFAERLAFEKSRYKEDEYFAGNAHSGRALVKSSPVCMCNNCRDLIDSHYCFNGCGDSCGTYYINNNGMAAAWQCYGFACQVGYDIFQVDPYQGWYVSFDVASIVPGDIIRFSWSADRFNPHAIFVTNVSGDTIYYADCNSTGPCQISWDNEISIAKISECLCNFPETYTDEDESGETTAADAKDTSKDENGKEKKNSNVHPSRVGIYHCPTNENYPIVSGDVNGDGKITSSDLLTFVRYIADADKKLAVISSATDVNGDTKVNARDYFQIVDYVNNGCPLYEEYWYNYGYYNPEWYYWDPNYVYTE